MANIKSAKKRILVNKTKMERNKAIKSGVKTAVKKVEAAVVAKDAEAAKAQLAIMHRHKAKAKILARFFIFCLPKFGLRKGY